MDNRPIGIFDSGLGGLTAVKEITNILPNENIIYFGDTGRVPYGTRSAETIVKYVRQDIGFLKSFNIKMIIIACGTASSTALHIVKNDHDIPIIGVVEPAAYRAAKVTKNKKIGIIGTSGTIKSGEYTRVLKTIDSEIQCFENSCPLFVPLVENGKTSGKIVELVALEYLSPLKENKVDTIILGCTHYPLLKGVIYDIMGNDINLVDAGSCAADDAKKILTEQALLSDRKNPKVEYYVSDDASNFAALGGMFLQKKIDNNVMQINIENY